MVRVPWTAECQDWASVIEGVKTTYCQGHHNTTQHCRGDYQLCSINTTVIIIIIMRLSHIMSIMCKYERIGHL